MNEKNIENKSKAGHRPSRLMIGIIAIVIVAMLTIGFGVAQYNTSVVLKNREQMTLTEAHDECPCKDLSRKIIQQLQMSGIDDIDFDDFPEFDPAVLCEAYSDEEAYQEVMNMAAEGLLGCGNSFSMVYVPGSSAIGEETQGKSQQGGIFFATIPAIKKESLGHWELRIETIYRTPEEVMATATALHNYCQGPPPPEGPIMEWDLPHAIAFCGAMVGAILQVPLYTIHSFVWLLSLAVCLDVAAYSLIDQVLINFETSAVEIFWACVNALTDGNYGP